MTMLSMKRLWGMVDGEPYLMDGSDVSVPEGEPLFFSKCPVKIRGKAKIFLGNPPAPFQAIPDDAYFDLQDLTRLRACSVRTILRHISYGWLKGNKWGKEYLFRKSEVERWIKSVPVRIGYPPKKHSRKRK